MIIHLSERTRKQGRLDQIAAVMIVAAAYAGTVALSLPAYCGNLKAEVHAGDSVTKSPVAVLEKGKALMIQEQTVSGRIKGRIEDYETRKPLAGVTVQITGTDLEVRSSEDGTYAFPEISVGFYVLTFRISGYHSDTRTDVIVRSGRTTFLNVAMLAAPMIEEEVSVTADYFSLAPTRPGSQRQFNFEELRRDAGSGGDLSRALYNVPGIVKVDEEANDLIVRGGHPMENGFYIDNIFIPNINHFPQQGASGGNVSWLNMDFIERLEIQTGGFDASYGNRLSSVIDIGYREGNRERIDSQINLGIIGNSAQIEGPFPNRKGAFMISAARSSLALIRESVNAAGYPSFWDIQGKLTYDLDDRNSFFLLGIFGRSRTDEKREDATYSYGDEQYDTATMGMNWRHLWGDSGYSDTALSYSFLEGAENEWRVADEARIDFYDYRSEWTTLRSVTHLQPVEAHRFKFGFEIQRIDFRHLDDYDNIRKNLSGTFGALFASYRFYLFTNLSLTSGLRLDYYPLSERFHLSPRLAFAWMVHRKLTVNGAFGFYTQQMPFFLLDQHPENRKLHDPRARHIVLGVHYLLRPDIRLTFEVYDKDYRHFPMSTRAPYFFVVDDVQGDESQYGIFGRLVDEGKAYARGVEFSVQKKISHNLYGLVSFSYYRARYRDLMGQWRNRLFDHRFILCLSGGYKPNRHWEFSARWIWSGNKAFTPVNEEKSRLYGWPWVDYEDIMAGHLANYQNLSLRADRRFYFKKRNLVVYAGALNILNRENELDRTWISWINAYESEYMWGIIPYVGLEFEF